MQVPLSKKILSVFVACTLFSPIFPAQASVPDETTTITLDQTVHFTGTDGSDVVADPGEYSVEPAEEWLRLIPGTERRNALLIEVQKGTHEVKVEIPIVISTPGSEPDELDVHVVQLLNPDGTSMVATGTYSGIQSRGLFDAAKKAAARARAAAEAARRAAAAKAKQAAEATRIAALKAKQAAEQAAQAAAAKAREAAAKAAQFAKITACKATVGAMKAGKAVAGFMQQVLPTAKQRRDSAQNQFKNDANYRNQLLSQITNRLQAYQDKVPELKHIALAMNNPQNRGKLDAIFGTDNFCTDSIATMDQKLIQAGLSPQFAVVRGRGADDSHFYMGYQISFGGGVGIGAQVGLMGVTDFRGNGGKYWFIGPQGITNAAVGLTAEVAFFPNVPLSSFDDWGAGVGLSAGPPSKVVSGAVDVMLDETVKQFQGFGFGPGVGFGVSPVDGAFSYTHSWKY
ncbi:MAG: hypothetical protein OEZ41_04000 [Nitrospirota bacterium]|nr:hypothetical protein [Nitrospirota bacterium]MDH5699106.1 hypothetical protein [Nitrospirota bacterium]